MIFSVVVIDIINDIQSITSYCLSGIYERMIGKYKQFSIKALLINKDFYYFRYFITDMECFGALNTRGFSSQIEYGQLPEPSHLTY